MKKHCPSHQFLVHHVVLHVKALPHVKVWDALKLLVHDSEQQRLRNIEDSHKPIETINDLASSDQLPGEATLFMLLRN